MGDMNAKVGNTFCDDHLRETVGKYGLGDRNERGEMWLQFCTENSLTIMNTCFQNHPRRLYTWIMPGDRARYQIDYIAIAKRWRSCITNTKTYPGADCGSDHKLLVAELNIKLKRCHRNTFKTQRRLKARELTSFEEHFNDKVSELAASSNESVEVSWNSFKNLVITTRKKTQLKNDDEPKKVWITEETWDVIKERKKLLMNNFNSKDRQYQFLSAEIQRLCRRDKNEHINSICQDIEDHAASIHTRDLFMKVKYITREFKPKTWAIEDDAGNLITEIDKVTERWRAYCEKLYKDTRAISVEQPSSSSQIIEELEPHILDSEIRCAINKLKNNKSAGSDTIFAEELKHIGPNGVRVLRDLCNQIWKSGEWINDWKRSTLIPLHKKGSTKVCGNYRTVALISHASKILLYVINSRLKMYLQWQIPKE
ncbi:hypothetical protein O0L34_g15168 [Tuta absoluta]|nr:hypothetical protein O0L34_g15168 [Tuta absoluta]